MTTRRLNKPATCPDKDWTKFYTNNPCRDWTCADLEKFINGPSGEPKAFARQQLSFRRRYNLV